MAQKDKDDPAEDYTYEVPDFDEEAFIHKELVSFRTTGILFVWGIVAALVAWGIDAALGGAKTGWYLGLAIAAAFGYMLKFIYPRLGADVSHFGRREWLGTAFLFFFTFLAFFILFVNPPISDHADPVVGVFTPDLVQAGDDVTFDIFLEDNHRISGHTFLMTKGTTNITTIATEADLTDLGAGHHQMTLEAPTAGTYTWVVTGTDAKGHTTEATGSLQVSQKAMVVDKPDDERLDSALDTILVRFQKDVEFRAVWFDLEHTIDDLYLEKDESLGGWKATANFAGWKQGKNNFTVHAVTDNAFFGIHQVDGFEVVHPDTFVLTVDTVVGDYMVEPPAPTTTSPNTVRVPGPGVPLILVGIMAAVVIARRRD